MGIRIEKATGQEWRETSFFIVCLLITFWILYLVRDLHIRKITISYLKVS